MGIINKLSPHVANLIAAGEVVERPASAVKELMENSIDAYADHITVEMRDGGIGMLRICDNGIGMTKDDACACLSRHATSKIATENDLSAISTLGFRGEALAAISAVSRVEIITRHRDESVGTKIVAEAGEIVSCDEWGAPTGTTITVSNIFYNTPARMKFLKKNSTEGMYVSGVVDRIAMSHPEIAIRLIKDGKEVLHTPGDDKMFSVIHAVLGKDFAESLTPVPEYLSPSGFYVRGYVTKPEKSRPNRNMQYFFLNGRCVKNRTIGAALEEAYRDSIMVGKFPGCVLYMDIDPQYVDCNVHPAKTEVKFANERSAFEAVYFAVKNAVTGLAHPSAVTPTAVVTEEVPFIVSAPAVSPSAAQPSFETAPKAPTAPVKRDFKEGFVASPTVYSPVSETPRYTPPVKNPTQTWNGDLPDLTVQTAVNSAPFEAENLTISPSLSETAEGTPNYRILGELFDSFIVVEVGNEALFIDKHAAHERLIYNRLLLNEDHSASQLLITPAVISVSKEELARINENIDLLCDVGLEIEEFGQNTVLVRRLPAHIDEDGIPALISEIASHLSRVTGDRNVARDNILHTMACKAAVKAGRKSGQVELDALVRDVLTLKDVRYCPHGRPVAVTMSKSDFEKNFKRI